MTANVELLTKEQRLDEILSREITGDRTSLKEAVQLLELLVADHSRFFRAWMLLGRMRRRLGERELALHAFEMAEDILPLQSAATIESAVELRFLCQFNLAAAKLNKVLEREPQQLSALFNLGILYQQQHNWDASIATFQTILSVEPDHFLAALKIAIAHKQSNRLEKAQSHFLELSKKYPDQPQPYIELGFLYRQQQSHRQAMEAFEHALPHIQQPARRLTITVQVAIELRHLGQFDAAEEKLIAVRSQQPDHLLAIKTLALLYKMQRRYEDAIAYYQQALELDPKSVSLRIQLSAVWRSKQDYPRAQQQLESALTHESDHLNVLLNLSSLACEQRDYERAIAYCNQACQAHPTQLEPRLQKAEILQTFHHFPQAISQLEDLLRDEPQFLPALLKLGYIARQQGQRKKALTWFQQAKQCVTGLDRQISTQLLIVEELQATGQLNEALTALKQLIHRQPEHLAAQVMLASILQQQLDFMAAEKIYRAIILQHPESIEPQLAFAQMLSETHRLPEAVELLEDLHETGPRDLRVIWQLGDLARAEENWAVARYWYQLAKKYYPHRPHVYGKLADVLYWQGNIDTAISLLIEAGNRLPDTPEIPLRLAELKLRFGLPGESLSILEAAHQRFPEHAYLTFQLCRLHVLLGQFAQAQRMLETIDSDQSRLLKEIANIKGTAAAAQFQLETAADTFAQSIAIAPASPFEHERLALCQMLLGDIDAAHAQLVSATRQQQQTSSPAQKGQSIAGHTAFLVNQLRLNPALLAQLKSAICAPKFDRLPQLGALIVQDPAYLGGAMFLCKTLRQQNVFAQVRDSLSVDAGPALPSIPRRIVQYWDSSSPPDDILLMSHSWQTHNPDYEYVLFSFKSAVEFLRSHYPPDIDPDILKAFEYCDHPATQADFFRLAYLNKMGGFYADADDRCRRSIDDLANANAEMIVYQEENACIANNFIGCVPNHAAIRSALYQAVANLLCYNNEGPWMQTGPGLLTTTLCSHLLPYLSSTDYRTWPRLWVLSQEELRHYVWWAVSLPYKQTLQNWQKAAYDGPK